MSDVLRVLQTKGQTRRFYNLISPVYDLLAESSEEPVRAAALQKLGCAPGERVLEVGFGTGHSLVALAEAVGPAGFVYGIDISEEMVKRARALLARRGLEARTELSRGDAERLPYADAFMDAVFMSFTLELFDTPAIPRVLAECRRVLRPGARIVVAGLSKQERPDLTIRLFEWTHRHLPALLDCRPIDVRTAVETAGFQVVDVALRHLWVPVEIVLGRKIPSAQREP